MFIFSERSFFLAKPQKEEMVKVSKETVVLIGLKIMLKKY